MSDRSTRSQAGESSGAIYQWVNERLRIDAFVDYMSRTLGDNPVLFACGLPASYKTETTEVIAEVKGYTILRSDLIRLEVLKNEDIFDEKVASNMDKRRG